MKIRTLMHRHLGKHSCPSLCFSKWTKYEKILFLALHEGILGQPNIRPRRLFNSTHTYAARLLAEHLDVNRCAYADMEEDEDTFNLTGDYNRRCRASLGAIPSLHSALIV